ncbi:hypothetical protein KPL78_19300 [Roseomonas sp. HJA6]|uniref:Uncharacterized protein n=1 Tax=Roseomonas alba TaxID=2846776 RepID=A0ABS7ACI4_9PROT|nr:hypothetical protein [Neoroseomonas alba]MBW6400016.1 hypothetical protein [Neoroseomonas alba]
MALRLPPDQPPEPPTIAELVRRAYDLPADHTAFVTRLLAAPGLTGDALLRVADAAQEAAEALGGLVRGDAEERVWRDMATLLRDAAPRFPHPPRVPLTAEEADASIRRRAIAAGLTTATGDPDR